MYASVRRYEVGAGSIDALIHRVDAEFAPALMQEPGFVSYVVVATGERTIEAVSVFVDEDCARRSDELAAQYVKDNLADFELTRTSTTGGDVLVSRTVPGPLDDWRHWRSARTRARAAHGRGPGAGTVVVVGATGRSGGLIVHQLVERGIEVRALVRDEAKARATLPQSVRLFVGDVRRPRTLVPALAGATAAIVAISGTAERGNSPELVDFLGTSCLVAEALSAGLEFILLVSSIYATRPDYYQDVEPSSLGWKARAEELVRESGLPYSIVRAGWLTDGPGGEPLAFTQGDVAEGRLFRADLADVCVRALLLKESRGKTFEVVAARDRAPADIDAAIAALAPDAPGPRLAGTGVLRKSPSAHPAGTSLH